jgi:hypothetical protein
MRHITPTLLFVLLFCSISIAQGTGSATAEGSFSVLGYATVTRLADLNFGNLLTGVNITIDPTDAQAAEFLFNGNANTDVQVTITFPNELRCGTNTMIFHTVRYTYNIIPNASTSTEFKKKGGTATTGADGNLYIWAGGRVNVANNQAAGSYTGIMQIVIIQP